MPTLDHETTTLVTGDCDLGIFSQCCLFAYATFFHGMHAFPFCSTDYFKTQHKAFPPDPFSE